MHGTTTLGLRTEQDARDDMRTVEELGGYIRRISALLNAAINTGAGEREEEACLVDIAHDEAHAALARYMKWALPEGGAE